MIPPSDASPQRGVRTREKRFTNTTAKRKPTKMNPAVPEMNSCRENPKPKKNPPVDPKHETDHEFSKKIGRPSAKRFIHENMVFPMREDFEIDSYELSFSSIIKANICTKNSLNDEARFKSFFVSRIPFWFKCCNEVRGDMVWKTKGRYFSKFCRMPYCSMRIS